jgi:hypothetical protein
MDFILIIMLLNCGEVVFEFRKRVTLTPTLSLGDKGEGELF